MQITPRQTLNILLVEDSPSDARLMGEALRETPLLVKLDVAPDGDQAISYLHRSLSGSVQRPDLILLDLNLPGKNGHEILAEVKADPDFKQIPILIMSSSNADSDILAAYSLNANCYITKPCDLGEYIGVVRAIEDFWFLTATLPDGTSRKRIDEEFPVRADAAKSAAH